MKTDLRAYHNRPDLKDAVLTIMAEHEAADRIVQGHYSEFQGGAFANGCAVGCTLESIRRIEGLDEIEHSDHALYERYLGVPRVLARLEDAIFESLPHADALTWPRRFASAIRPGADLSMVWPKFLHRLLSDADGGVQRAAVKYPKVAPAIAAVIDLYGRWIEGVKPTHDEWVAARRAAAAAADAAYAAADAAAYAAAAADAAADAADADAAAAAYAYAAAHAAAAAADARVRERRHQADLLIALLEAA